MKRITSLKGEYGIGFEIGGAEIRDLQSLIAIRKEQIATIPNESANALEHRMELVKNIRGIDFINDAATSNANGIYMTLSNLQKKVIWITGFDQWGETGNLFADLMQFIKENVASVVFVGDEASPSRSIIEGMDVSTEYASDMETAVRTAFYSAGSNQAVLYCPGTPAKDESISDRGYAFKNAVAQL